MKNKKNSKKTKILLKIVEILLIIDCLGFLVLYYMAEFKTGINVKINPDKILMVYNNAE